MRGARLVGERCLLENVKSKAFRIVTAILLLISIAAVVLPQVFSGGATTYTLATVGPAPQGIKAALSGAAGSGDFSVSYLVEPDSAAVQQAVRDGEATVGLADGTIYTAADGGGSFSALLSQAVMSGETVRQLQQAGLSPQQVADLQSIQAPAQVALGRTDDQSRSGVGFLVGIVLYMALTFAGSAIATTVATEKSTRISEVLLAVLRPSQILVGTVVAVGVVTLAQLLVLTVPLAIAVSLTDSIGLPPVAAGDLILAIVWFGLGFALYAFVFAATAALVDKVTEVTSAVLPVTLLLLGGYLLGITVVVADPSSVASVLASIFPFSAPLAMPIRWASGEVPVIQLVLAMLLTAATALALVALASRMYGRALLITGRRVRIREVVGH